jgi:hypothetical protein
MTSESKLKNGWSFFFLFWDKTSLDSDEFFGLPKLFLLDEVSNL